MTHLHVICSVRIMKLFCSGNVRDLCFLTYYLGRICSLGKWSNTCRFPQQIFLREKCPLPQLWVMTPLTRVVQPLSDQHQLCLSAEHSLTKAQQNKLMAGLGPASCSFPYQAKSNAAHRRNCRNSFCWRMPSMSAELHPQGTSNFQSSRYLQGYFEKVSKGNIIQNTWYSLFPRSQENLNSRSGLFPL